jgi:prephenate dehydratase
MSRIAFQGEPGAFSHQACREHFPEMDAVPCATFEDAFAAVQSGDCRYGLIPFENLLAGRVSDVHHLLPHSKLRIIGERFLPIHMQLMAPRGTRTEDLTSVQSHPMALAQCRKLIRELKLTAVAVSDTAGAARDLAEHPQAGRAAIAPKMAAELYGLEILRPDIEDAQGNATRFLLLTAERDTPPPAPGEACITSFLFRVRNVPAALYKALGGFATNGANLIKLESYLEPSGGFHAAMFYAEVEGRPEDKGLAFAFEELAFFSSEFEVLGTYAQDPFRAQLAARRA